MDMTPGFKQTDVGTIPDDWETARIPDVAWYQEGPGVRNHQFTRTGVKLFNGTNIENGRIRLDNTSRYISEREAYGCYSHFLADAGDVVIACSGITVHRFDEKVGVLSEEHLPLCMNTSTMRFKVASPRLHKDYFKHFLRSKLFKDQISGQATGSAQLNFGPAHVGEALIPLPDKDEQEAIAKALSDADALIESLEQLVTKKHRVKQGTMQVLLTGRRRLPGFSGRWVETTLARLGVFSKGSGIRKHEAGSGDLACIRYGEIYTRHNDYVKAFYSRISPEVAATAKKLRKGDLLFAGSGETREEIGKCVAFLDDIEAYAGGDIIVLRPARVDSMFFGYYLNSPAIVAQKARNGQGDAVVHISSGALASLEIKVPEREEQTAISSVLSDMDEEIAILDTKLTKTRQIKQGLMRELLTGRIRLV